MRRRGMQMLMVHFRSTDLKRIYSQGRFWHANFLTGGAIVNQDEEKTFTVHQMVSPDVDMSAIDAREFLFKALGGIDKPCVLDDVEILVKSTWRSELAVANSFRSAKGRVFLAGDAGTYPASPT